MNTSTTAPSPLLKRHFRRIAGRLHLRRSSSKATSGRFGGRKMKKLFLGFFWLC